MERGKDWGLGYEIMTRLRQKDYFQVTITLKASNTFDLGWHRHKNIKYFSTLGNQYAEITPGMDIIQHLVVKIRHLKS